MEMERLLKLDEEAVFLEEDFPLVRSLSMSRNMALSMIEEVSHMIKLPSGDGYSSSDLIIKKSSSTPSLTRTHEQSRKTSFPTQEISGRTQSDLENIVPISRPLPLNNPEVSEVIKTMGMEGIPVVESRSTLSQLSYPSVRSAKKNELLTGIVVSRWDNIVGPQCVYLWTEEVTSIFYPGSLPPYLSGVIKYVTDHTVDHQDVDGNLLSPATQRTTLCIVPDLSLVYISISIRVPSEIETILEFASSSSMTANDPDQPATSIPHAVAILANLKFLSHFLLLRPLVVNWLNEFAPKIGVLLCRDKLQSSMINSWCAELCKTMTALKTCWVQEIQMHRDTLTNKHLEAPGDPDQSTVSVKNLKTINEHQREGKNGKTRLFPGDMEYLPPNLRHVSKSGWSGLLTSHLSTFGSSIIVGFDTLAVNQVVRFLLCFSSVPEGYCSRYSLATLPDTFMKGLFIQGLILGGIGEKSISYNQVSSNRLPFTYVELGSKFAVRQMNPQTHSRLSSSILMQDLRALWTSAFNVSPAEDPYPQVVKDAAGFVTQFIDELMLLPTERRYGRLLLFRRVIHAKAISLITYLHSIRHLPVKDRISLTRQIPEILGFDEQEYVIVQVTAEKIKSGVMKLLICPL